MRRSRKTRSWSRRPPVAGVAVGPPRRSGACCRPRADSLRDRPVPRRPDGLRAGPRHVGLPPAATRSPASSSTPSPACSDDLLPTDKRHRRTGSLACPAAASKVQRSTACSYARVLRPAAHRSHTLKIRCTLSRSSSRARSTACALGVDAAAARSRRPGPAPGCGGTC